MSIRAVLNRSAFVSALVVVAALVPFEPARLHATQDAARKLDDAVKSHARRPGGSSRVIIRSSNGSLGSVASLLRLAGGTPGRTLKSIRSQVAVVPNAALRLLATSPDIERISLDRPVAGAMDRTAHTVGASAIRQDLGYDGSGIGVAVVDSGITSWHDDLAGADGRLRVSRFVDFVTSHKRLEDEYGHGTHVAGIIAGNGFDSDGGRTGIAPGAHLVVLRVLDGEGRGYVSDVIAALEYAIDHRQEFNIRIVNVSIAAGVFESYNTDPLTLAAQRAVQAGMVVVAAAGNIGQGVNGRTLYGGITSPGNAPWVLTVGASSHMGTIDRVDDTIASFTSRGPTAIDIGAKPDLVAPGLGIESLSNPASTLYSDASPYLLPGTKPTSYLPYLSLSGTSMSAPVVSGTAALMLQANPALTPNQVKAILQYTAQVYANYDPLTEGAGFLNAKGAIQLARHLASPLEIPYPDSADWSASVIWGNRVVKGGRLTADANAWSAAVMWGARSDANGAPISWGVRCESANCTETSGSWSVGSGYSRNVVWGSRCEGDDCSYAWTIDLATSADGGETVVWGTDGGETVVWGTDGGETVVWGTDTGETVVWGTSCHEPTCRPVIWGGR
jgi:serine protease AprX